MKKIIKSGTVGRATCASCECEFTFEREDIIFRNQFDADNMVTCPCCGKRIVISSIVRPKKEGPTFTAEDVCNILIKHGQKDLQFKVGETIKYSPADVYGILKEVSK